MRELTGIVRAIAGIAALECADHPNEFDQIQRSILTAIEQTYPEIFKYEHEEEAN